MKSLCSCFTSHREKSAQNYLCRNFSHLLLAFLPTKLEIQKVRNNFQLFSTRFLQGRKRRFNISFHKFSRCAWTMLKLKFYVFIGCFDGKLFVDDIQTCFKMETKKHNRRMSQELTSLWPFHPYKSVIVG